ncbi:two-component system, OmpR family, sensor kinase [Anaerolineales bacterium]|nr:two-component system, OmpR family, sensor kinase [Anaerolineales bacterium]
MRPHDYRHHTHFPPPHWTGRRRAYFRGVAFVFGGMTFFMIAAIAVAVYFIATKQPHEFRGGILIPLCGLPLLFMFIASLIGRWGFRRFGSPMADFMSAVDAVAEGDLNVRVREHFPGDLGQLARRFNHMIAELERADQQRRNLTADIAHELRTPLHIIQGNLEGIIDGVYEATPEHINNTLEETQLLARLVNDLQTLSLAEAGQLPLHPTRFLIADLMADLTSSFSSQAASLGVDLQTEVSIPSIELTADYDRLNQALSNLISNSLRHTSQGGRIFIRVSPITNNQLQITIQDTGSGIPPEDLPFVFDRFWRGDKSRSDRSHSGLGLAIAKQIVLAHGGTIDVESKVGEGTMFVIEIPVGYA